MKTARLFSVFAWLMLLLFSAGLRAQAATEPSVHQIYEAATSGDIRGAQQMIDQVIAAHPNSARAHYVKAELSARERDAATARAELATAERLAPGLPFARPDAVTALRAQVERLAAAPARSTEPRAAQQRADTRRMGAPPAQERSGGGFPFGAILLAAMVGVVVLMIMRRRRSAAIASGPGQQPWGVGGSASSPGVARRGFDIDPQRGYDPAMGPGGTMGGMGPMGGTGPQQGSMGSSLMRGLGTGLAVGAGAVAAQEIGRRMFDHGRETQHDALSGLGAAGAADSQIARDAGLGAFGNAPVNEDLGGQDFGITGGDWDDGGGMDMGGGGSDWDN
ncbi:MAG: uncharacterized protein JWP41_879 [Ramlibacter sp.]|nr:uncharacterized protein [Ramlibacter sp.]